MVTMYSQFLMFRRFF